MDKKLIVLSIVFFIIFVVFVTYLFTDGSIAQLTRAESKSTASPQKSLVFAWPLSVKADGTESSEITVFVRNEDGAGLIEKSVSVTTTVGTVTPSQILTDTDGKATFTLTSTQTGVAQIEALVNNIKLPRKITVEFN